MANLPPVNINSAQELRYELHDAMRGAGKSGTGRGKYIPYGVLKRLTGTDIIERVVMEISSKFSLPLEGREELVARLSRDCPILVAIFVYDSLSFPFLKTMVQYGITDKDLPLSSHYPSWLPFSPKHPDWSWIRQYRLEYDRLFDTQWHFQAAAFHSVGQHQNFNEHMIVPYLEKTESGKGGFSVLYKVRIEPSHQKVYSLPRVRIQLLTCEIIHIKIRNNG
jgi:hypothetical protein